MRILHVITSLHYGGAEKLLTEIVPMMRDKGHHVDVCAFVSSTPNLDADMKAKGINVIYFSATGSVYRPSFIFKLARLLNNYDIVNTHNTSPQYFLPLAALINRILSRKHPVFVYTEHNTSNRLRKIPGFSLFARWANGYYDKIICVSDKAAKNLHEYLPSLENICVVNNGVDVARFHDAMPIREEKLKDKTVVAMVALFRREKDHETLIKSFANLPSDKFELWLIGDGTTRPTMEQLSHELGVQDCVKFLGIRNDIPELLHTADIVVMSSHYEGLSLSSVEGMSVGKPFVASDVDGLREVVGGYGVLFPHQDAQALSSELMKLASDREYYNDVANRCWTRAQMFDIHKMVDNYLDVYTALLK